MAKRSVKKEQQYPDKFMTEASDHDAKLTRAATLHTGLEFDEKRYEYSDRFVAARNAQEIHTIPELVHYASQKESNIDIAARVMGVSRTTIKEKNKKKIVHETGFKVLKKSQFLEVYNKNTKKFREADPFGSDYSDILGGLVGDDFIPLLGGPFNKQLYYYDYLRMHAIAFHAANHDPFAKRIINIINHFVLGKGFRVDVIGKDKDAGQALWDANEKVNNIYKFAKLFNTELSIYGESLIWKLPNNEIYRQYQVKPGQEPPRGIIPRLRLIDPSSIWEIVTYPEDIERVLYYKWVAPTQYQIYTGRDADQPVPSTKFIIQDLMPEQITHEKLNYVSNEKRGRSELFPILGYLKRLRDSVNYSIIGDQKNSAWGIDTSIDGSDADIDAYIAEQQSIGTIAPAGSEFVHSKAVERKYNANAGSGTRSSQSFEWCVSMVAVGAGIPLSYFGTHLTGVQSRASAIVGTEPVTKMFEDRQNLIERVFKQMGQELFKEFGLDCDLEITFPEIVTSDRSTKIKDIIVAQQNGYISKARAASMVAKELAISSFDYDLETIEISDEKLTNTNTVLDPLTQAAGVANMGGKEEKPPGMDSDEKSDVKEDKDL